MWLLASSPSAALGQKSIFDDDYVPPRSAPPPAEKPATAEEQRAAPAETAAPPPRLGIRPDPVRPEGATPVAPGAGQPGAASAAIVRQPVPPAAALARPLALARDVFKAEYAVTSAAGKQALAKLLWSEAGNARGNVVERFVLLRETRDLATGAGDVELALEAARAIHSEYVTGPEGPRATLAAATAGLVALPPSKEVAEMARRASELAMWSAERELAAGEYPAAAQAAQHAVTAATKCGAVNIIYGAKLRAGEIGAIAAEHATAKPSLDALRAKPNDAAANETAGRFLAFVARRTGQGIPMLARGTDPVVKAAAAADIAAATDGEMRPAAAVGVGDAWTNASRAQAGAAREGMQRRALFWYDQAAAASEGLAKAAIQKKAIHLRVARLRKGLLGEYFRGRAFDRKVFTAIDPMLDLRWTDKPDSALDGDYFSVRWSGFIRAPSAGLYNLTAVHDDGVRVLIDGVAVIDNWGKAGKASADVQMTGQPQELRVEYHELHGEAFIGLGWRAPSMGRATVVPASALFHEPPAASVSLAARPEPDRITGEIALSAVFAELHGTSISFRHRAGEEPRIGTWHSAGDWVSFDFAAPAGAYEVQLVYGCERGKDGSTYALTVGNNRINGTVKHVDGAGNTWQTESLGLVYLSAGEQTLKIKPLSKPGEKVMSLREVILTPVK